MGCVIGPASFLYVGIIFARSCGVKGGYVAQAELAQSILALLESKAAEHGVDIVDVDVVGATKAPCVRVRIDHADESAQTITLDEVAAETGWISDVIDEADPIEGSFTLEVSSPGMDRPLRRPHDFERFAGEQVVLKTRPVDGRSHFTGLLKGFEDGSILLECDGTDFQIPLDQLKSAKIKPSF